MSFTSARQVRPDGGPSRWSDVGLAVAARAVSACGDFLAATALLLTLQSRGAGGYAVAALLLSAVVPPVLLVRWTGRLADRVDSRLLLVATGLAQAAICAAMAFTTGTGVLIGLATLLSCGYAVTQPVLGALLPAMVRREDLVRAGALGQTATSIGMLVAPALAGVLTGAFGVRVPLFVDAASYLALVVGAVLIRTRRGGARTVAAGQAAAVPGPAEPAPAWRLRADPLLFTMVVMAASAVAAVSAVNVADVFLVRVVLHSTATMYGVLTAVWTGAAMIGGWLLARRDRPDAAISVAMLGALGVVCAAVLAMGLVPSLAWLVPVFLIGGVGNGMLNVSAGALLSRRTPPESRGTAAARFGAVISAANALGFLLGGVLLGVLPVRATVAVAGVFGLVVTAAAALPMTRAAARERAALQPAAEPQPATPAEPATVGARQSGAPALAELQPAA
jgi:MFS family permease